MTTTTHNSQNETYQELFIESMSSEAQGIARLDGLVYFVEGAVTGETVLAKIVKRKKNFVIATVEKIISPTQYLNPDYDSHRDIEGGSSIFRLSYEQQLKEKHKVVQQAFSKIARLSEQDSELLESMPIFGSTQINHYRNKAIYPAGINDSGEVDFGYYQKGSHTVIFNHDSVLEHENNATILGCVKEFVNQQKLSVYRPDINRGLIRSVLCRVNARGEHLVCLVVNSKQIAWGQEFAAHLQQAIPQVTHVGIVYNNKRTPVQLQGVISMITPEPFYDYLGDVQFEVAANAFFQINRTQALRIYHRAVELAQIQPQHIVWDMYCGVGSLSAFLAQQAKKVRGNEIAASAVSNAKRNMKLNGIHNAYFDVGEAEKVIPQWMSNSERPDVVVLDPPRKGANISVLDTIAHAQPQRIVYVSCKPSTCARDVAHLQSCGYSLSKLEAYDFFPHTMHIECVALLEKK